MLCPSCAFENPVKHKFCGECGHPFATGAAGSDPHPKPGNQTKGEAVPRQDMAASAKETLEKLHPVLFENSAEAIFIHDLKGNSIDVNRRAGEILGYTPNELVGMNVRDITKNLDYDLFLQMTGALRPEKPAQFETQLLRKDGTEIPVEVRNTLVILDGRKIIVSVARDLTRRRRAEESLRESEGLLRSFMDNIPSEAAFRNLDGKYFYINRKFAALHGKKVDEIVGASIHDLYPFEEAEIVKKSDEVVIRTGRPQSTEWQWVGLDGIERTYFETRFPVFDAEEKLRAIGILHTDITEQKRTQKDLEDAYGIIKTQKERMENELNVGAEIQLSMIPLTFPPFPEHNEFSIFASLKPAREVAGDFYDFYFIDNDHLFFCIGDVSGKGVPAALFMAITKTLIKSRASEDPSTASILTSVNDELARENSSSLFVTVFLGVLDIVTGELKFTNAGHNPPFIKRSNGEVQRLDDPHGLVIGIIEGTVYEEHTKFLAAGDFVYLYTDGVTEEMNQDGEQFSEKRLVDLLRSDQVLSDQIAVNKTVEAVENFRGELEQNDDITVLSIMFAGGEGQRSLGNRQIHIKNDLNEIRKVNDAIETLVLEHDLPEATGHKINLILDDFLQNVISYGFQDNREHEIKVKVDITQTHVKATITDDGVPFNPLTFKEPEILTDLENREVGGLGIHLARKIADDIVYQRRIDKNVLTITLRIEGENWRDAK